MDKGRGITIKYNLNNYLLYMILIPFLYPKGFSEYFSIYKLFFTAWLYASMAVIFLLIVQNSSRIKYKSFLLLMLVYHVFLLFDTLAIQGGITSGLQKIFAAPAICLFCAICLRREPGKFIGCVANILMFNFFLNLTIFNPYIVKSYFSISKNMMFLGHVQVAAQLGVLGIFVAYLERKINPDKKNKSIILMCLSVLTMLISATSASYLCLMIILVSLFCLRVFKLERIFRFDSRLYVAGVFGINAIFLYYLQQCNWDFSLLGRNITFNGRVVIWKRIFELLQSHWLLGYGAYGTRIRVYWSAWSNNTAGMTYAHSQLLQVMLDGGICLLLIFIMMTLAYTSFVRKSKNKKIAIFSNICLIVILVLMLPESLTEYFYVFIFLSLLGYLPEICLSKRNVDNRVKYRNDV